MRFRACISVAGLTPLLIAAAQPVQLEPSSPWVVDYAENSCRLVRTFGSGKTLTQLGFESQAPGAVDMLITGDPLRTSEDRVAARFVPNGTDTFDGRVAETVQGAKPAILWAHVELLPEDLRKRLDAEGDQYRKSGARPPAVSLAEQARRKQQEEQFATAVTGVAVQTYRNRTVVLHTGSLGAPMKAFEQCDQDSLKDWGVDPAVEAQIVRPVWAINQSQWLFASDYPRDMAARGKESQVAVRLLVDASGKVTKCTSLSHFPDPEFNRITCELITQRARFEPAELADGTKVPSYYAQRVVFNLSH